MITIIIILIIAIAILTYMVKQRNTWLDKANKKIDQLSMSKTAIEEENETLKTYLSNAVIDREKYKVHPDCRKLYCFVYDPEGLLGNPNGIKKDLESNSEDFIKVFIRPE